jgi:hypothetical protein
MLEIPKCLVVSGFCLSEGRKGDEAQDIAAVSKPAGSGKFIGITIVIFVIIIFSIKYL